MGYVSKYKVVLIMSVFLISALLGLKLFMPIESNYNLPKKKAESKMDKKIKKVVLDNGLNVLVFKNNAVPKVLLQIVYDVGSWIENSGEKGLAHLIEHMIFKGTKKLSETDIDAIAKKYGASHNAFTSKDMTSYYFEVNKSNWKPFMDILADCMQNARFDEQHLASELCTVIQELKMCKDRYWSLMFEKACEIAYPANHPYHFPIIGFKQDLLNVSSDKLKHFYEKYYGPERATLFVVGDVDIDEVIEVAKKDFGGIPSSSDNNLEYQKIRKERFPFLHKDTVINDTALYEQVNKSQLGYYWLIPGEKEKNDSVVSSLEFILGQGDGSRLYKRLVDEEKVAVAVAAVSDHLIESGVFLVLVEPVDGKSLECEKIIKEELNKLVKDGVTKEELLKVKKTKKREFFQELQSLTSFTYQWIKSYLTTKNEFDVFNKVEELDNVNSAAIQNFAQKNLDPFFMNKIELLPLPEDKKAIWQQAKEESEGMDLEILSKHPRTSKVEDPKFINNLGNPNPVNFSFPTPDKTFTLNNGLKVIFLKNGEWPICDINCHFKDSTFFSESKEGILINLMMSLLIEKSLNHTKEENVNFFESEGVDYAFDSTGGNLSLLSSNYQNIVSRFFDILTKPDFTEDAIAKIKNIFIDYYQRKKDSPSDIAGRLLRNVLYKNHPYEWTFNDAINLVSEATIEDLKKLHKKYVNPESMTLTIVGNFDLDKMEKLVKNVFDTWSGEKRVEVNLPERNFIPGFKVDEFLLRDQVVLVMGQPSSLAITDPDLVPVKMLNFICFNSLGSRLFRLREQTGLFYTAFGFFAAGAERVPGIDYIGAVLSLDKLDEAEKLLVGVINDLGAHGVTQEELDSAKQLYLKALIDLTASNETIALMLSRLEELDLGFNYYDDVLKVVQNIKLEDINNIAKKYFVANDMGRIRVGRVGNQNI